MKIVGYLWEIECDVKIRKSHHFPNMQSFRLSEKMMGLRAHQLRENDGPIIKSMGHVIITPKYSDFLNSDNAETIQDSTK